MDTLHKGDNDDDDDDDDDDDNNNNNKLCEILIHIINYIMVLLFEAC